MRRLNVKLLVVLIVSTVVLGGGVFALHEYQVHRHAEVFKQIAHEKKEAGDIEEAVRQLNRYLHYRPNDVETTCDFALWFAEMASLPTAQPEQRRRIPLVLEQALRSNPDRDDLRRRLAEFMVQAGRVADAKDHLTILMANNEEDGELKTMMARCMVYTGELEQAVELYQSAIEVDPQGLEAYAQFADLLSRRLDRPEEADAVMQQLAEKNPDNYEVYLMRYDYRTRNRFETRSAARDEIVKARELAPDNVDVILKAVESAISTNEFDEAEADLERGLELHPENVQLYISLATLEMTKGSVNGEDRSEEASAALQRGLEAVPDNPLLLVHLTDVQIHRKQFDAARRTLERLAEVDFNQNQIDFLTSRILIGEERWVEASRLLQKVRQNQAQDRRTLVDIDLMLAQCYGALGQLDLQIVAYQRALDRDSFSVGARLGLARALAARGDLADAENELARLQTMPGVAPLGGEILRLRIAEQLRMPKDQRNWEEINTMLGELVEKHPDSIDILVLKSRVSVFQDQVDEARELVIAAKEQHPKSLALWAELADIEANTKGPEAGLAVLADAREALDNPFELRIAEIAMLMRRPQDEALSALKKIAEEASQHESAEEQTQLIQGVGEAMYRLGQYDEAMSYFQQVAERRPNDLTLRLLMFAVAREAEDNEAMEETLASIEKLVGKNHTYWQYCEAARLVSQFQDGKEDRKALDRARQLVESAQEARPNWSSVARLDAEIEDLSGNTEAAIEKYQRAIRLGETQMVTSRRLVQLLYLRGRFQEAEQVLNAVPANARSGDFGKLATDLQFQLGEADNALQLADSVYDENSTDYIDHLWYGRVLDRAGRSVEAEKALRRAVDLAPEIGATWISLVRQLAFNGEKDKAREALTEAEEKLPAEEAPTALANGYEVLGNTEEAERHYVAAVEQKPDDLSRKRALGSFYVRSVQHDKAFKTLQGIIDQADSVKSPEEASTVSWARRAYAQLVASRGSYADHLQALKLIDDNAVNGDLAIEDRKAKAMILASRNDLRSRREAIRILEGLVQEDPEAVQEIALLAQMYEKDNQFDRARQMMLSLLTQSPDRDEYVPAYAAMLLRHEQVDEAALLLDRLRQMSNKSPVAMAVQALLLAKRNYVDEAILVTRRMVSRPLSPQQVGQLRTVAEHFENLGGLGVADQEFLDAAEDMYKEYVSEVPGDMLVLAAFYGRHRSIDQALDLCEEQINDENAGYVANLAQRILHSRRGEVTADHLDRVGKIFDRAREQFPEVLAVQLDYADYQDVKGNYEEAMSLYRQVIDDPQVTAAQRAAAQNNLAYLLVVKDGNGDEALRLIEDSIRYFGPVADLLDTRGMAHLARGDMEMAIRDFSEAVEGNSNALNNFHLAWAYYQAQDKTAAAKALATARKKGLQDDQISPLELANLQKMQADQELIELTAG